jgi:hypothetical protein
MKRLKLLRAKKEISTKKDRVLDPTTNKASWCAVGTENITK